MAKTEFESVDQYIASRPKDVQTILKRVRSTIHNAVPQAEESISYKIPAYKLRGDPVLYFAGWKQHVSIYPATATVIAAFKDDIAPYLAKSAPFPACAARPREVDRSHRKIPREGSRRASEGAVRNPPRAFPLAYTSLRRQRFPAVPVVPSQPAPVRVHSRNYPRTPGRDKPPA